MSAYNTSPLDDDTLAEVADLRARGKAWGAVAAELACDERTLRRAARRTPGFDRAYERAAGEVRAEAEAEALAVFRLSMTDPDPDRRLRAAAAADKHIAAARRDRTRLEVEQLRAGAVRAKADAKRAKDDSDEGSGEPEFDARDLGPEEVHRPHDEDRYARRAADTQALVWLWGGAHPIGGTVPDPATDTPLVLYGDDTMPARGKQYWAVRFPLPGNPFAGLFPAPPQDETVPDLTPEQAAQLHALPPPPGDSPIS